jgi:hypothetical protein
MIPGPDNDDGWVMVEDEFLSTAKLFTEHLHQQQYIQLKELARQQNASRISREILRPVDGKTAMSEEVKKREEAEKRTEVQQEALEELGLHVRDPNEEDDDDIDDVPFLRDPHLRRLVSAPPKPVQQLNRALKPKATTRAAAGFKRPRSPSPKGRMGRVAIGTSGRMEKGATSGLAGLAQELGLAPAQVNEEEDSEDDDTDDLDSPIHARYQSMQRGRSPSRPTSTLSVRQPAKSSSVAGSRQSYASFPSHQQFKKPKGALKIPRTSSNTGQPSTYTSKLEDSRAARLSETSLMSNSPQQPLSRNVSVSKRLAKARAVKREREAEEAAKKKDISLDEIPTFMF